MARFKVVITDYDYGDDAAIERAILEPIGAQVVASPGEVRGGRCSPAGAPTATRS